MRWAAHEYGRPAWPTMIMMHSLICTASYLCVILICALFYLCVVYIQEVSEQLVNMAGHHDPQWPWCLFWSVSPLTCVNLICAPSHLCVILICAPSHMCVVLICATTYLCVILICAPSHMCVVLICATTYLCVILICAPSHMCVVLICATTYLCVILICAPLTCAFICVQEVSEQLVNMADQQDPCDHDAYPDLCHLLPACCQCPEGRWAAREHGAPPQQVIQRELQRSWCTFWCARATPSTCCGLCGKTSSQSAAEKSFSITDQTNLCQHLQWHKCSSDIAPDEEITHTDVPIKGIWTRTPGRRIKFNRNQPGTISGDPWLWPFWKWHLKP